MKNYKIVITSLLIHLETQGIGKIKAVKVLSSGFQLRNICNSNMSIKEILEAIQFVARCVGSKMLWVCDN